MVSCEGLMLPLLWLLKCGEKLEFDPMKLFELFEKSSGSVLMYGILFEVLVMVGR